MERLAALLKLSRRTVIYSGAGISTAAGIGQAARSGGQRMKVLTNINEKFLIIKSLDNSLTIFFVKSVDNCQQLYIFVDNLEKLSRDLFRLIKRSILVRYPLE